MYMKSERIHVYERVREYIYMKSERLHVYDE